MANFEFNYPVVYFDWQEKQFTEGVLAFRADLPNNKDYLLDHKDNICLFDEAWIVGYRDAEEDHNECATCNHIGMSKPETPPKELFRMAIRHTQKLQRKRNITVLAGPRTPTVKQC